MSARISRSSLLRALRAQETFLSVKLRANSVKLRVTLASATPGPTYVAPGSTLCRRILEVQRLARDAPRDRSHAPATAASLKPCRISFSLPGYVTTSPIAKTPGIDGLARRRIDLHVMQFAIQPPRRRSGRDPSTGRRTAAAHRPAAAASRPAASPPRHGAARRRRHAGRAAGTARPSRSRRAAPPRRAVPRSRARRGTSRRRCTTATRAMSRSDSAQSTAESPPPAITTRLPRKSSRRRT